MIVVVYGTTGELIKLAPLLKSIDQSQYMTLCTGQQAEQIPPMLAEFNIPEPDYWLGRGHRGRDLSRMGQIPGWLAGVIRKYRAEKLRISSRLPRHTPNLTVVHGDTLTTVIGSIMGRTMGLPVAHIEAGLRSFNWRNPFPEELDRLATSRLARIHFAPGKTPVDNLKGTQGVVIDTMANTIQDALRLAPEVTDPRLPAIQAPFGLVSIHRNELLGSRAQLEAILQTLNAHSRQVRMLFVDHPVTTARIRGYGLDGIFNKQSFIRIPKLSYFAFITLLKKSEFLVTDSGGVQEECAYLDHPCLVHRLTTERTEGLGSNVALSKLSIEVVRSFLANPSIYRTGSPPSNHSPTSIIVDYLRDNSYVNDRTGN
ncbi:MAG TPA: UDP-N-acetylglucosamine 2-epimerase [Actinomycetota bacterium]|nr:UDP-N-acetylglucosamine 2-epimerase [Actinomycetota bacterium]